MNNSEQTVDGLLKFNFLCNASKSVPLKLRSNFGFICNALSDRFRSKKSKRKGCQYCLTEWSQESHKVKLKPAVKPGSSVRRILRKLKSEKELTSIEKNLLERAMKGGRLVTTCLVCRKSNKKCARNDNKFIKPFLPEVVDDKKSEKQKNTKNKTKQSSVNVPVVTLESSFNETPSFVIDTRGDLSNRGNKIITPAVTSKGGFIPLQSSTPVGVKKRKRKSNLVANPLCVKNIEMKGKTVSKLAQKKRLSTLKKLIEEDSQKTASANHSLKSFLNTLK